VVGRPFAAALEPIIKQPVVIDTKAGAAARSARSLPQRQADGYTLLVHIVSISGFAEMDKLFGRQPKFTRADFIRSRASPKARWRSWSTTRRPTRR
jgi:tripartite-type tricarboxylate transporter receptor subunit TctC